MNISIVSASTIAITILLAISFCFIISIIEIRTATYTNYYVLSLFNLIPNRYLLTDSRLSQNLILTVKRYLIRIPNFSRIKLVNLFYIVKNNKELEAATYHLLQTIIPRSAIEMLKDVGDLIDDKKSTLTHTLYQFAVSLSVLDLSSFDITQWTHSRGINMR